MKAEKVAATHFFSGRAFSPFFPPETEAKPEGGGGDVPRVAGKKARHPGRGAPGRAGRGGDGGVAGGSGKKMAPKKERRGFFLGKGRGPGGNQNLGPGGWPGHKRFKKRIKTRGLGGGLKGGKFGGKGKREGGKFIPPFLEKNNGGGKIWKGGGGPLSPGPESGSRLEENFLAGGGLKRLSAGLRGMEGGLGGPPKGGGKRGKILGGPFPGGKKGFKVFFLKTLIIVFF